MKCEVGKKVLSEQIFQIDPSAGKILLPDVDILINPRRQSSIEIDLPTQIIDNGKSGTESQIIPHQIPFWYQAPFFADIPVESSRYF